MPWVEQDGNKVHHYVCDDMVWKERTYAKCGMEFHWDESVNRSPRDRWYEHWYYRHRKRR